MSPTLERFENGKKLFVVDVVIQLRGGESPGVESDRMNLIVGWSDSGQNGAESIGQFQR